MIYGNAAHQFLNQIHRAALSVLIPEIDRDLAVNLGKCLKRRKPFDGIRLSLAEHHDGLLAGDRLVRHSLLPVALHDPGRVAAQNKISKP